MSRTYVTSLYPLSVEIRKFSVPADQNVYLCAVFITMLFLISEIQLDAFVVFHPVILFSAAFRLPNCRGKEIND